MIFKMKERRLILPHTVIKATRFWAGIDKKTTGKEKIGNLGHSSVHIQKVKI